jgi:hypothetical protein
MNEEQEMAIKEYAAVIGVAFEKLKEAFKNLTVVVGDLWVEMKELLEQPDSLYLIDNKPDWVTPNWVTPKKLVLNSQVLNRKPLLNKARSCC